MALLLKFSNAIIFYLCWVEFSWSLLESFCVVFLFVVGPPFFFVSLFFVIHILLGGGWCFLFVWFPSLMTLFVMKACVVVWLGWFFLHF